MQRLKRVFAIDLSECPWCGAQLHVIAEITDPKVTAKILVHIGARQAGEAMARMTAMGAAAAIPTVLASADAMAATPKRGRALQIGA